MGADLIGYMVVGPETLNRTEDERAAFFNRISKKDRLPQGRAFYGDWVETAELDGLPPNLDECEDSEAREYWLNTLTMDLPQFLAAAAKFEEWWNGGRPGRDTAQRHIPKIPAGRKLHPSGWVAVFSGEPSWGDEPDGYGYNQIKEASRCRVLDLFGIH